MTSIVDGWWARRNPTHKQYPTRTIALLEDLGASVEQQNTDDRHPDGHFYIVTAKHWPKPMLALVHKAVHDEHKAYTDIIESDHSPHWQQALIFERNRRFYRGLPVDDRRVDLAHEVEDWMEDPFDKDPPSVLKTIAADAGYKKWPTLDDEDWSGKTHRTLQTLNRDLLDQIDNAAPFQLWSYWRERAKDFLEPANAGPDWKAAMRWMELTPNTPEWVLR